MRKLIDTSRGFDKHDVAVVTIIGLGVLICLIVFAPFALTALFAMSWVASSTVNILATLVLLPAVTVALTYFLRRLLVIITVRLEQWSGKEL